MQRIFLMSESRPLLPIVACPDVASQQVPESLQNWMTWLSTNWSPAISGVSCLGTTGLESAIGKPGRVKVQGSCPSSDVNFDMASFYPRAYLTIYDHFFQVYLPPGFSNSLLAKLNLSTLLKVLLNMKEVYLYSGCFPYFHPAFYLDDKNCNKQQRTDRKQSVHKDRTRQGEI